MGVLMSDENGNLTEYAGNKLPIGYAGLVTQVNNMKAEIDSKVEKVDVIYDMYSSDINLNLSNTSGILGGVEVSVDLSKYKKLIVSTVVFRGADSANTGGTNNTFIIDMSHTLHENYVIAKHKVAYSELGAATTSSFDFLTYYKKDTHILTFGFTYNETLSNNNGGYYVYRIEGVY